MRDGALDIFESFLSTLPARGATDFRLIFERSRHISIHAPREGSDGAALGLGQGIVGISIHAPREGSDPVEPGIHRASRISIHAPREGSDAGCKDRVKPCCLFLSTLPARGATQSAKDAADALAFLSTLPARGATALPFRAYARI